MESTPAAARGEDVRRRLRAAATELIPERGWAAVSTRTLAERAGVTPSVVHYHYPSLRALLNEAVVDVVRRVLDDVAGALDDTSPDDVDDADDAIDALIEQAGRYSDGDPASLLAIEGCLAAGRDPELRDQLRRLLAEFRGGLADRLASRGVPAPEATAAVLAAALDGLVLHDELGGTPDAAALSGVLRRLVDSGTVGQPSGGANDDGRTIRP